MARFVGEANIVRGTVGAVSGDRVEFLGAGGKAAFLSRGRQFTPGEPAALAVRGEQAQADVYKRQRKSSLRRRKNNKPG